MRRPIPDRRHRLAALAAAAALVSACAVAPVAEEETTRLATDPLCQYATPGNALPGFRCRGDFDSWD